MDRWTKFSGRPPAGFDGQQRALLHLPPRVCALAITLTHCAVISHALTLTLFARSLAHSLTRSDDDEKAKKKKKKAKDRPKELLEGELILIFFFIMW